MTALLATLKSNTTKRRVGWSQILFNLFSASVAWLMLPLYKSFIPEVLGIDDQLLALVSFHSLLNLVGIMLVLPFLRPFCGAIAWLVPHSNDALSVSIHDSNPNETQTALDALHLESHKFLSRSISLLRNYFDIEQAAASQHIRKYDDLKRYENEIALFGLKMQRMPLSESDASELGVLVQCIRNAATAVKDIKDIGHNLEELRNSASDELFGFYKTLQHCQQDFYQQLQTTLDQHSLDKTDAMLLLKDVASTTHRVASDDVYRLFSGKTHHEIMIPSLLNLIRAVNNSNESLMRSLLSDGVMGK
jgi:phosphate:Na+ symporter